MAEVARKIRNIEQIFEASGLKDYTAHSMWNDYERLLGFACHLCMRIFEDDRKYIS